MMAEKVLILKHSLDPDMNDISTMEKKIQSLLDLGWGIKRSTVFPYPQYKNCNIAGLQMIFFTRKKKDAP